MAATLISVVLAFLLVWNPPSLAALAAFDHSPLLFTVGSVFLLILASYWVFATFALQRAEKRLIPRVIDLFRSDWLIRFAMLGLAIFVMLSFVAGIPNILASLVHPSTLMVVWILLLGLAIDAVHVIYNRVMKYVDPISSLDLLEQRALHAAKGGDEVTTAEWLDSLATLANKSLHSGDSTLAERAVSRMYSVLQELTDGRLRNHITHERLSFPFVFYAQRLEVAFARAAHDQSESLCLHILNQLGKATVLGATVGTEIATLPLVYVMKLYRRSKDYDLEDIPDQCSVLLVEVARSIVEAVKVSGGNFRDPVLSIIGYLEEIELDKFSDDPDVDFDILKQPFRDLFAVMKDETILKHPDTVPVLEELEHVVGNFANLQLALAKRLAQEAEAFTEEEEVSEEGEAP
ncbi:MAG: hypothetical protein KDK78_06940 [Chlamydiia bacterium]|nr:hypothetical protein [Chlamydiia bacterium]